MRDGSFEPQSQTVTARSASCLRGSIDVHKLWEISRSRDPEDFPEILGNLGIRRDRSGVRRDPSRSAVIDPRFVAIDPRFVENDRDPVVICRDRSEVRRDPVEIHRDPSRFVAIDPRVVDVREKPFPRIFWGQKLHWPVRGLRGIDAMCVRRLVTYPKGGSSLTRPRTKGQSRRAFR